MPPTGRFVREDRCQAPVRNLKTVALRPPIDLMYAAGAFEAAGGVCRISDCPAEGLDWADLVREIRDFGPDFVLLSITTPTLEADLKAAALIRSIDPSIQVAAKGAHFNTLDQETLQRFPDLNMVLRGEIEETCLALAQSKPLHDIAGLTWRDPNGAIHRNVDRDFPLSLDELPLPARHLVQNELYARPDTGEIQTTVVTNRGCPFKCMYCLANQTAGVRNRYRSVESVLEELRSCVGTHGIRSFLFRSELFTQNRLWVIRLCRAILEEELDIEWACNARVDCVDPEMLSWMRRAGCWIMAFGVESGDQRALDRMRKQVRVGQSLDAVRICREAGIRSSIYLLMGLPWDTRESAEALTNFAVQLDPDVLEIFFPYPFPGTELRRICIEEGLLVDGAIPSHAYDAPAFEPHQLDRNELMALRRRALRRFYLRPAKVFSTFRTARNGRELLNILRLGMSQLRQLLRAG